MSGFESLLAGRTLSGRYLIEALIGRGGMGAVYRARDERLGRTVAVKVISAPGGAGTDGRGQLRVRFQREARAAARLHHPNVVTIHDFGTDAELDLDFLVMALLDGADVAQRLARGWRPSPAEAVGILRGAARGLAAGHRIGMVHRDVKPGNLFLCEGGDGAGPDVRVLDFGIVQVTYDDGTVTHFTRWGGAPLSPAYAAPEQLRGATDLAPACDVYGLGAIGYELLAGRRPLDDAEIRRIADGKAAETAIAFPADAGVPEAVGALLLRCMAPDPRDRPADAAAFLNDLDAAVAGATLSDVPPPPASAQERTAEDGDDATALAPASPDPAVSSASPAALALAAPAAASPATGTPASPATGGSAAVTTGSPRHCTACGRAVDADAMFCPRCGVALARRRRWRMPVLAASVATLLAVGAAAAVALPFPLVRPASPVPVPAGTLPEIVVAVPERVKVAEWEVEPLSSDGSCGNLFDACRRVQCSIRNVGDAEGTVSVTATVYGDQPYVSERVTTLRPGRREILVFDFPEVHQGEPIANVTCDARPLDGEPRLIGDGFEGDVEE